MTNTQTQERWRPAYTLGEAAQAARISQRSLHRLIKSGKLQTTLVGGRRIVPGFALQQLIEGSAA